MNRINRSSGEILFHQMFTDMRQRKLINYPKSVMDRDIINEYYIKKLFPSMKDGDSYILYEVYLGTIFQVLEQYVKLNQPFVLAKRFGEMYLQRDISFVDTVNLASLSVDYVLVKKENGKILFEKVMELQGAQHNAYNPATSTMQIVRDILKAETLKELNIPCKFTNSEFAKCGVRDYDFRIVEMECMDFIK